MMTVLVDKLELKCVIGIFDFERENEQRIFISAKFRADEFVDYARICEIFKTDFKEQKFFKLEDALLYFETKFRDKFSTISYFYMKILKPDIIDSAVVGVEIERFY
ncbi:MAG: dihydroneopterin aldolase [Campylobacter sp.]|nr:dihydroneopterin aldolase [Campylobacter sp.]